MTILLTTHYLDEAERLCDRVAIMHDGRVVALDTPAALLRGLGREIVELRVDGDAGARARVLRAHGARGRRAFAVGSTLTLPLHDRAGAETRRRRSTRSARRQRDHHARAHARRRLPAPDRRPARRRRLTTEKENAMTANATTRRRSAPPTPRRAARRARDPRARRLRSPPARPASSSSR